MRRLNQSQRIIVVTAWAAALFALGRYLTSIRTHLGTVVPRSTGSGKKGAFGPGFGLSHGFPFRLDHHLNHFDTLAIWVALIAVWTVGALLIFRTPMLEGEDIPPPAAGTASPL